MTSESPPSEILHVILTRFNVRSGGKEQVLREQTDWLRERFVLFDQYCFPSVAAQTRKDFIWMLFFDAQTPEPFKEKIRTYQSLSSFTPVFVDQWSTAIVLEAVKKHVGPSHRFLLTTRLDNDDAIHSGHVENLRQHASPQSPGYYIFPEGLIFQNGRVFHHRDPSNAFASYLEPIDGFVTAWRKPHHLIQSTESVNELAMPNAWFQVVHGRNVSNRVKGRRVSSSILANGYKQLDGITLAKEGPLDSALETVLYHPFRQGRELAIKILKPLVKKR